MHLDIDDKTHRAPIGVYIFGASTWRPMRWKGGKVFYFFYTEICVGLIVGSINNVCHYILQQGTLATADLLSEHAIQISSDILKNQ